MDQKELTRISKFMSLVLRHQPERADIALDENGWVALTELLEGMNKKGFKVTESLLRQLVETNNKQRFAFDESGTRIRASQGHSVAVALGYEPQVPPPVLYHGTAGRSVDSIMASGIQKRSRQHVHLSVDATTAIQVGGRHGKPVVLAVDAAAMQADGFLFFLSDNMVWLTEEVPVKYIRT